MQKIEYKYGEWNDFIKPVDINNVDESVSYLKIDTLTDIITVCYNGSSTSGKFVYNKYDEVINSSEFIKCFISDGFLVQNPTNLVIFININKVLKITNKKIRIKTVFASDSWFNATPEVIDMFLRRLNGREI